LAWVKPLEWPEAWEDGIGRFELHRILVVRPGMGAGR